MFYINSQNIIININKIERFFIKERFKNSKIIACIKNKKMCIEKFDNKHYAYLFLKFLIEEENKRVIKYKDIIKEVNKFIEE